jgi:uncharacterized membrane protein YbaN (DUF454 family)
LQRWLLALVGVLCVIVGGVGVFVPGLPTTVFVLIASYCFTRSCPWLEDRLLRNRVFARSMRYVDGELALSTPQRAGIAAIIALFSGSSIVLLHVAGAPWFVLVGVAALGVVGMVAVALWRRRSAALTSGETPA